ncbi:2-amino-4-hydroxy-6-hydroxymethyldihydropteridine diphosphokinase [Aquisalimonas sp. 2447]|uniref:2-amino-4-hydroxy-6- hydroxymethyldihydropteridine diphosphokinase n=1 Tax=Aquisalimonas sp. 2447 TaxID=2740807 RepID=UPI0014324043|nr:2-amino-4-hydroxy-6-hydroxymethyldihydropteridine diphosphokinase [Aquisalimonas sp. 2447]QIT56890.1 2-amino-4-hydroxy-6-hydroxymethyldihydropteridine diphosphokinase [Aquisalimonas sp. 2447]
MVRVYVSVGSNIQPARHVRRALQDLRREFHELQVSPVYASAAVGFDGDDFLNLVVGFDTGDTPEGVAERLRRIEDANGRVRGPERYAARTLDLDALTYGDQSVRSGRLILPRDEITRYAFVLRPLADIAGDEQHPELGRTYAELWAAFDARDQPLRRVSLDDMESG